MRAIVFDLDGTLWNAVLPITDAWREVGRKHFGPSFELSVETVGSLMGKTMDEIAKMITPPGVPASSIGPFVREAFEYEKDYLADHPGDLFPRELETLNELSQRYRLYIVSNAQAGYIENYLRILPKPYFLDHMCWSDTKQEKAKTILALMERHDIAKDDAVYVGDTVKDREAARKAGISFVYCAYGFENKPLPDEITVDAFSRLPEAINEVFR